MLFSLVIIPVKAQTRTGIIFQENKPSFFNLHSGVLKSPGYTYSLNNMAAVAKPKPFVLNYKPVPMAFFCQMEDRFRNNFHIFLKIRMGNDESYMKMIRRE